MGTQEAGAFLHETLAELLKADTSRAFTDTLVRRLGTRLRFDAAAVFLYRRASDSLTVVPGRPDQPAHPLAAPARVPAEGTLAQTALSRGQALRRDDMAASDWAEASVIPAFRPARSCLVAPLIPPGGDGAQPAPRGDGVIVLASRAPAAFTREDQDVLARLGRDAGPILDRIAAAEEREALRRLAERLVVGTVELHTLMSTVKDALQDLLPHDLTGLVRFIQDRGKPWFEPLHVDGGTVDVEALRRFPFERMAPAAMLRTGRPVLVTGQESTPFSEMAYFESIDIRSGILCPLLVHGEPYGFLAIGNRRRNAFSPRDLALAEQVSHLLSQAIANLVAYEEIRVLKERAEHENTYLREEVEGLVDLRELVGTSPALQATLKAIERVAPTGAAVLITGETGTGKELVARAVHQLSPRSGKALVKVNCAALPPGLIESELFGHERGAFTHALARKPGRFELANGGTIFLDEVGELPLEVQAKLLRVLESQELERVGSTRTITLDLRVIAATNRNLEEAVRAGTFRADLFYRLNVFPILVPPLRERREDIPSLVRHFVRKFAGRHRKPVRRIDARTMTALTRYEWPGNVRELEHVVERAVILAQGSVLEIEEFVEPAQRPGRTASVADHGTLADAERAHILAVLARTNWVVAGTRGAAAQLGVKRSTLQHRMRKLGISRSSPAGAT